MKHLIIVILCCLSTSLQAHPGHQYIHWMSQPSHWLIAVTMLSTIGILYKSKCLSNKKGLPKDSARKNNNEEQN